MKSMEAEQLRKDFAEKYGSGSEPGVYRAPGRVNLIGEHTDYNGGLVLPIAVDLSTGVAIAENGSRVARIFSSSLDEAARIRIEENMESIGDWSDYARGIISGLMGLTGREFPGFDIYLSSEVPVGRGLSSSAALEMAIAAGLNEEFSLKVEPLDLIRVCQRAENDFAGANTGIMDQYVSYYGKEGAAVLIDTSEPSHRYVELDLSGYELLVVDTMVSHTHGGSEYNERRRECGAALQELNQNWDGSPLRSLSEIEPGRIEAALSVLPEKLADRARHVVEENERVKQAADYLEQGKVKEAGELFFASHRSLRDLYEVSCRELDFLVEFASDKGIPGARMTGGGFGGASVHIVPEASSDSYYSEVKREYRREFGIEPEEFFVRPSNGVQQELRDE